MGILFDMQFAQKPVSLQRGQLDSESGSIRGADVYEYKEAMGASWDANFLQLSPGKLQADIDYITGESFTLYRETWHQRLHMVGALLPGIMAIGIPAKPDGATLWWRNSLPDNCIAIARSNDEVEMLTGVDEPVTTLTMMEADFLTIFQSLTGLHPSTFPAKGNVIELKAGTAQKIRLFWDSVLAQTNASGASELGIVDLVAPLLSAMDLPITTKFLQTPKSDLLHHIMCVAASSDFRASIPEICAEVNISRRTLEYVFHELMGESPSAYFTKRRLNLCYQALSEARHMEVTVTAVATMFGFYELGRFASVYHRYFGELPSDTLHRTKGFAMPATKAIAIPHGAFV